MRQERPNVDMAFFPLAVFLTFIMNGSDQPISVPANIEYHVSIHGVRILEGLPYLNEIVPPHRLGGVLILLLGPDQVISRNNVHALTGPRSTILDYFSFCKVSRKTFHFAKF
jgi:hypothetical protein